MNIIKVLIVLLVFMFCASCSSSYVNMTDDELGELKRLCEKDAGLNIYKTVEAEGYYDAARLSGGFWHFIPSDYNFVEYCDHEITSGDLFDIPGCWRLTKVSRKSGKCDERVDRVFNENGSDTSIEFREQNCIAVEKIEKQIARYRYDEGLETWVANNGVSKFKKSYVSIQDTKTGKLLSQYISYSYSKTPGLTSRKSCYLIDKKFPSYKESNIMKYTIKSTNGEIQ